MPALPRDRPSQPEADGAASANGEPSTAAALARDELRRAAQAAHALHADAAAVLELELDRAGQSLGRGVWAGVRTTVLLGAALLGAVVGGVLVCVGASGLLAASLDLGPNATLLLEGSVLLACAAIVGGTAWWIRRRRKAALDARRRAAREALATSAGDLAASMAHAADPRPWLEEHPLAGLAAALVAGLATGGAARRRHARARGPASPSDAPPGQATPAGPAEARASDSDASRLAALVMSLAVPLLERWLEEPAEDKDD